jgi:hypothetical protein
VFYSGIKCLRRFSEIGHLLQKFKRVTRRFQQRKRNDLRNIFIFNLAFVHLNFYAVIEEWTEGGEQNWG